jgi:hypothetical protein
VAGQSQMSLKDASQAIDQALRNQKIQEQIAAMKNKAGIQMDQKYFGSGPVSSNSAQPASAQ